MHHKLVNTAKILVALILCGTLVVFALNRAASKINYPLVGIVGFFPVNFPDHTITQLQDFVTDIRNYAQIYGVNLDINDLRPLDFAVNNFPGKPLVLVVGNSAGWENGTDLFISNLSPYLAKYPQIRYLSIGNEINVSIKDNEFEGFYDTYSTSYTSLKQNFPNLKIFTTFQYEDLLGQNYIGGNDTAADWSRFEKLKPQMDIIGITVYPFLNYQDPATIPDNYLDQLRDRTDKQIGITETGWPAEVFAGGIRDYGGSVTEQITYLSKLQSLSATNLEFWNWFSLNDINNSNLSPSTRIFAHLGLKNETGTERDSWAKYLELSK